MANEAVIVEFQAEPTGCGTSFTCVDGVAISGGTLLKLLDARRVSGGEFIPTSTVAGFAGIAAADKEAGDGATTITVYTQNVIADIVASGAITAGSPVILSGTNTVAQAGTVALLNGAISGGFVVGRALETATDGERINVEIGAGLI